LEQRLEERIAEVNQRIAQGLNEHFQIKKRGQNVRWTLTSLRQGEPVNHPLFDALKQVEISSVMNFVNQQCRFMEAFEHILGRYVKQEADNYAITAGLIAWGTNMGLTKMSQVSDIGYYMLASTSGNFIRLETLTEVNDRVSNAIAQLPIFRYYDIGDILHSSSDGQKFETRIHTINARHSPKYFGLKKGIVSYTLVANHIPVNAEIIGANDHESHYVFDILFNNTTDVQPEVHSTDTHGTNEVNFAILHFFGYQFAPRYKDIHDKVSKSLYGFKHPSQYDEDMLLRPIRKITPDLVISEWENIQRIIVSLSLKTTTQSIIVSKLSAYARKNQTKRALWEYDNIIRSLYLLDYIDSPPLRSNVQRALNRGENYHQLRRAVSYANFGKLRFKTEQEQQIWNECSRLITNCIIYYNATILSHLLSHKETTGDSQGAALIKQISPVAWQHINLHGRYEFSKHPEHININDIIQQLDQSQDDPVIDPTV
ncbi:MAG: transposase, partial [Planctomycetes bacterium]|nr:transposase [Planctomycetota bacterium]